MGDAITLNYRVRWKPGGASSWASLPGALGFDVQLQSSAAAEGLAFGAAVTPRATIRADAQTLGSSFYLAPVTCEISVNGGAYVQTFRGFLIEQSDDGVGLTYSAAGVEELIRQSEATTDLLYRRPIATASTATSIEDPTDPDYRGGLLNQIAWAAGGRPYFQTSAYPTAIFYYQFDESTFSPEWSWLSGEDTWAEALAIVQTAGGQLYQDAEGTLRYIQPLSLGTITGSPYNYSATIYNRATQRIAPRRAPTTITCRYARRRLQPQQEIYTDDNPQIVEAAAPGVPAILDLELPMQWPIWRYEKPTINIVTYAGAPLSTPWVFVDILSSSAQLLKVRVTSFWGEPLIITSIKVQGQPVTVTEEGVARYDGPPRDGRTTTQRASDSIYIQNPGDARRVCRMLHDFYNTPRPLISLAGCPIDPVRFVGEYVTYTAPARRGGGTQACRIVNIRYSRSGATMDVDLVPVAGIPTRADLFIVGTTYADGTTKKIGY